MIFQSLLALALIAKDFIVASSSQDPTSEAYTSIAKADLAESYEKIMNVPLKKYEFIFDSVSSRIQMGVMASDAQIWFPVSNACCFSSSFLSLSY